MSSLRERLAALRQELKASAPTFHASPRKTKVAEVVPNVSEFVPESEMPTLRELVEQHLELSRAERIAKRGKKPVAMALKALCHDYGVTKAICDGSRLTYYPMTRSHISPEMLMEEGVSLATIKRCTVTVDSYAVRVTQSDDDADDEETPGDD